jgi:hypothetical protein
MTNQKFLRFAVLSLLALVLLPQLSGRQNLQAQEKRFHFKIDPTTPIKELLPIPPKSPLPSGGGGDFGAAGPWLVDNLAQVPEVQFQEPIRPVSPLIGKDFLTTTAHQIAKVNFLNRKKTDHFMEKLIENRPDLTGLPFVMGDACRFNKERGENFRVAVLRVRVLQQGSLDLLSLATLFGKESDNGEKQNQEYVSALMQMMPPETSPAGRFFVNHLANFKEKEATRALTRLALHGEEGGVRLAALKMLRKRSDSAIKDLLLEGMEYPWPAVVKNAAEAMVYLKTADLVPNLVTMLDRLDPRAPVIKEIKGKKVAVVRELVRINHHRNCLLCHAPGNTPDVKLGEVLTRAIPDPGESMSPSFYENKSRSPDILVRADVTYLRQDFSRMQKVQNAAPCPEMQRFDFLVRTRILTDAEAKAYQAELAKQKTSPYRHAAQTALRALTGRDAEPTAAAWRKVLALSKP